MNFKKYLPIYIIAIAFLLRIYHANQLFFWHVDEDILALTVKRIVVDHHIQLIGYSMPGGIYLGPLFYYLASFFYFINKMNPFGLPFFAAIMGGVTTLLVYTVGSTIFVNKRLGLFASVVFGFSYLVNVYSRVFTGLTFAPIYSLLVYLFLYQNIKNKKPTNLIPLGLVLILAVQNEGSSISLFFLVLAIFLIFKFKFPKKDFLIVLATFVAFHLPLLIFDLRHNFFIAHSFLAFFSKHGSIISKAYSLDMISGVIKLFPDTLSRFLYIPSPGDIGAQILPCLDLAQKKLLEISPIYVLISLFVITFFVFSSIFSKAIVIGQKIVFWHFVILAGGLLLFNIFLNGYLYEWVLVVFFPGFALMVGYFINFLWERKLMGKILVLVFLAIFVVSNVKIILSSTDNFGLSDKAEATRWAVRSVGEKPFFLDSLGSCFQNGYIYLFWYYGKQPITTYADDIFTPTFYKKTDVIPKIGVVMVNPSQIEGLEFWKKYAFYKDKVISRKQFVNIEVLIVDENKGLRYNLPND